MTAFLIPLGLTILFECLGAFLIGVREKKEYLLITLVNVLTNPAAVYLAEWIRQSVFSPVLAAVLMYGVLEPIVILVELVYYKIYGNDPDHAFGRSVILNLTSIMGGLLCRMVFGSIWR
ncbi:MAG: hypothetical protein IIY44_08765 [Erysipelotrichales bacterium]|nr:hypothetical protein [Erysipelotrichales bacterium]MBQ1385517.1 hypothetical protein [Erysipelotrichales bacterium]MBQ2310089.1 hypothetical protein [Erysipelotrichales bacterium]MBQ2477976.1 hypothetical protein [Erysipelotrichales bacterium]MBQ5542403.1 hypothetical protein [Erysipelotrichales bacterium]